MAAQKGTRNVLPSTGLVLIGIGMGTVEGLTLEAINAAKAADHRWYEAYTALWPEASLAVLEETVGPVERVMRPDVEAPERLFSLASTSLVALLVVGDPLQATTHVDLQLRAIEHGIPCAVVHGISITNLVTGAVGLSNYRFGRQTTLTYPYGDWVATSPLEVLASNKEQNLHTLALLDLDPTGQGTGEQRPMCPADAVNSLRMMWQKLAEEDEGPHADVNGLEAFRRFAFTRYLDQTFEDISVVLCSDMGTPEQQIVTTTLGQLSDEPGGRLNCLVFPANASEVEEKALTRWVRGE